jgi:uncharacterized membrane protein
MYYVIVLAIAACLGLIPANIAKNKGYSFGLWWFYGWMLFIVAIIHVQFIPDKNAQQNNIIASSNNTYNPSSNSGQSVADELKKYKDLLDQGVITEDEFQSKKEQLLKLI